MSMLWSVLQARETLAEIPGQLIAFMKANNIKPNPPILRRHETTVYGQPGEHRLVYLRTVVHYYLVFFCFG